MPKPFDAAKQYARYDLKSFDLIPLHRYNDTIAMKGGKAKEVGKAPIDKDWTRKPYSPAKVLARCIEQTRNIGIRLREDQLVIDVDPRNKGDTGFENLCNDLGLDPDEWPRVKTGSGGWHCYMRKPADILVRDTLDNDDYKGVEFKSKGRQVVAAGSRHPNGKFYSWSDDHPNIEDGLPKIPTVLLNMIKRPPRSAVTGGGQLTQDQAADVLSKLDVHEFGDNDSWLQLMMAIHHATNGDARTEFVEWSIGDPKYAHDADWIGRRWDSLHTDRNDGVTYRTLNMILRKKGAASSQAMQDVGDDFDDMDFDTPADDEDLDDVPFTTKDVKKAAAKARRQDFDFDTPADDDDGVAPEGMPAESLSALEELNDEYLCLLDKGKFKIMYQERDPDNFNRQLWTSVDRPSFETLYLNRMIERDTTNLSRNAQKTISLGEAWIRWPTRREIKGMVFSPDSSVGEKDGYLNLWNGFDTTPDKNGSWDLLRELIFECICDGNDVAYEYILNWVAFMFQNPAEPAESAIVLKGGMGVGKGTLGNALVRMVGQHAMAIGSSNLLTGRFNAHMQNLIFLFADEAVNPYERAAESVLRHLITEPSITIEKKGVDSRVVKNLLHIMMASNDSWVIPAGKEERRFMVQHVNSKWQDDKAKFGRLHEELRRNNGSGYRRFMFDMMLRKFPPVISKLDGSETPWHPREIPMTQGLIEQKMRSMGPVMQYFFNSLTEQRLDFPHTGKWAEGPIEFFLQDFKDSFAVFCRSLGHVNPGGAGRGSNVLLMAEIKDTIRTAEINRRMRPSADRESEGSLDTAPGDGCAPSVMFPSLSECIRVFELSMKFPEGQIAGMSPPSKMDFG